MTNKDTMAQMLGKAGEAVVRNILTEADYIIRDCVDQYDHEKDMLATKNGVTYTVEVKTEQPYVLKNMVTFPERQLKKCLEVDYLFFVLATPRMRPDYKHSGKVLFAKPKQIELSYTKFTTKEGLKRVGFKIEQSGLKHVANLTPDELQILSRYTVSEYSRGYSHAM